MIFETCIFFLKSKERFITGKKVLLYSGLTINDFFVVQLQNIISCIIHVYCIPIFTHIYYLHIGLCIIALAWAQTSTCERFWFYLPFYVPNILRASIVILLADLKTPNRLGNFKSKLTLTGTLNKILGHIIAETLWEKLVTIETLVTSVMNFKSRLMSIKIRGKKIRLANIGSIKMQLTENVVKNRSEIIYKRSNRTFWTDSTGSQPHPVTPIVSPTPEISTQEKFKLHNNMYRTVIGMYM